MKTLKTTIALWLCTLAAFAADRITLTVAVTNLPVTGNTFTNNGSSRYWTNVLSSGTILTNAAVTTTNYIERATTNLFTALVTYPSSGNLIPSWISATQITLIGQVGGTVTATAGGDWCSLTFSTQVVARQFPISVPLLSGTVASLPQGTNVVSLLVTDISQGATNSFASNSIAMAHFTATNGVFRGVVSNATIGGNVYRLTNGLYETPKLNSPTSTNLVNYGTLTAGSNLVVDGDIELNEADTALSLANGYGLLRYNQGDDILTLSNAFATTALEFGSTTRFMNNAGPSLEISGSITAHSNFVSRTSALMTNTVFGGTNQIAGSLGLSASTVASIANGNNTIAIPDRATFVTLTGAPSATWTNCAMSGSLWDGRLIILDNATGQNMTIAHQSGFDGTVGRRIVTSTAADVVTTGRRVTIWIYSAATSRWLLVMGG